VIRDALVLRLLNDWDQIVYTMGDFLARIFKRAATRILRQHRHHITDPAALRIGDILLHQSRRAAIRDFIREKIEKAQPPVILVAHSLGGIACFDLLALPDPPAVARVVTVGSQAAFFCEIGALTSLKRPQPLPVGFPPWLNVYDRNDFLSYTAKRLFPGVKELEARSGQAFPESHSAYFANDEVWQAIRNFASP
jgi:pimeloyl-ACP methyl ester carboxylesterase